VVITGKLRAPEDGTYRFVTQSDDDSYFVINGRVVAAYPGGHADDTNGLTIFPIDLVAGQEYTYQYYMSEGGGGHGFHARWVVPSDTTQYSTATPTPNPNGGPGFQAAPLIPLYDPAADPTTEASKGGFTTDNEGLPVAPSLPAGGQAAVFTNITGTTVQVNYVDNSVNEVRHELQLSTDNFATIAGTRILPIGLAPTTGNGGVGGGATSGTATGLTPGTTYQARLLASNYDGKSSTIDLGSVTTLQNVAPTTPLARVLSNGNVQLTWTDSAPQGAKVSVKRSVNGGAYNEIAQVNTVAPGGTNSFTDINAKAGNVSYHYQLATVGSNNLATPAVDVPFTVVPVSSSKPVDYSAGFDPLIPIVGGLYDAPTGMDLHFNGNTAGVPLIADSDADGVGTLRLTTLVNSEASSVWTDQKVPITGRWVNKFDFQVTAGTGTADGFTFTIQNNSNTFIGGAGGAGGYDGIGANAVGIGFDTYNNHSTSGVWLGNAGPTSNDEVNNPYQTGIGTGHGINLNPGNTGVSLHTGHNIRAVLSYDGTNMSEMLIDLDDANKVVFNYNYGPVNLQSVLGGTDAWIGFTGATGGANENVDIQNWTFSNAPIPSIPDVDATTPFTVNDGSLQRSLVQSVTVKFNQPGVQLASGALQLIRDQNADGTTSGADISSVLAAPTSLDGGYTWTWTFTPDAGNVNVQANGSLTDGVYHVVVDATKVSTTVGTMSPLHPSYTSPKFHRLFGDIDGSKRVNATDYNAFRAAFGANTTTASNYVAAFDFDSNGRVNAIDYNAFRARFGKVFSYT